MAMNNQSASEVRKNSSNKVERAWMLTDTNSARDLYDEWALEYDGDLKEQKYASPRRTVEAILSNLGEMPASLAILDAGCGTGLVGDCLSTSSIGNIMKLDGIDLSPGMLDVARNKGIYHKLELADLSQKIALPDASYDIVVCVGTLTRGHVGPAVLFDFARLLKPKGLIAATVHGEIWQSGHFEATVNDMQSKQIVEIIQASRFGMLEEWSEGGIMLVMKKL